ncbi:MAG: aldo/keto reductase [Gammaproteobacteria bacterium]|nr:aldo/keto reductase [Gammaproteobacteria bacterium]
MSEPPGVRLGRTDLVVDRLGFGGAPLGNLYTGVSDAEATKTLGAAWAGGIRLYDTAPHYGQGLSERRIGDALRGHPDYVLSTKVGRLLKPAGYADARHDFVSPMPFDIAYDYSYAGVLRSFEDSLQRLGLDRIDILLLHDIGHATHGEGHDALFELAMCGGYRALSELRATGAVRAIGLGVNETAVCEQALEHGDWDCFLVAGRYTLLEQGALQTLLPACEARGVSVLIGGPYNSGILAGGRATYNYRRAPDAVVEKTARLEAVCGAYGAPLAAAALQFPLAHPAVAAVLPGIDRPERVDETLRLLHHPIPSDLWRDLKAANLLAEGAPVPADLTRRLLP